jgi:hypothetical protein
LKQRRTVLKNLFEKLDEMGISPIGTVTEAYSGHTEYREVCGLSDSRQNGKDQTEKPKAPLATIPITEETGGKRPDTDGRKEVRVIREPIISYRPVARPQITKIKASLKVPSKIPSTSPVTPPGNDHNNQVGKKQKIRVCAEDSVTYCFTENEREVKTVQIVAGPNQPSMGIINIHSPLGKALLGAEVGDEVELRLPTGIKTARVLMIE